MNPEKTLRILAIEDNPADSKLIEKLLRDGPFELECVDRLSKALARLAKGAVDMILLDLSLPDAQGLDCFYQMHCQVPHIPIVVLTGLEDESVGSQAVQSGAQDYLVKGQVSKGLLSRSIRYAIERHQSETRLKQLNDSLERRVIQLATANQELNKLAQALALSNEQALQASRFKSQFVDRISHEVRTPISAVLGITDLLLQEDLRWSPDEHKRLIELIDEAARSQLSLLTEVLDLSKLEAGKIVLENVDFSPVSLVEGVAELFAATATKKGVSLMTYVDPALQPLLQGAPARLREILLNLTSNAVKFTPQGEVIIRATRECEDEGSVTARFSVTDSGIGLPETGRSDLFEPFVQMPNAPNIAGTGLGLSICKRLVDLMAGQIGAESIPGKGSTFWFSVRLRRAKINKINAQQALPMPGPYLSNVRVLIVDPSSTARDIIQRYIDAAGGCSAKAANADECLDMLHHAAASNDPFNIALVDLGSNPSNSFDLAAAIQQDPVISTTRLIFVTAFDQRSKGEQAWSAGFSAYLTKPIKQGNLLDCIFEVVNHRSQEHMPPDSVGVERILVAEGDSLVRKVLVRQLEMLGVQVDAVKNGREAVEAVSRVNYALILMDQQMPEMTGIEATHAIRELQSAGTPYVPIIAISIDGEDQERRSCIEAGMDEYLLKPILLARLHEVAAHWLLVGKQIPARIENR